jgi:ubiquinone/menaquinone biosynthesis C-methylase UbiE
MAHPQIYSREYYQRLYELDARHWWNTGMREIAAALVRSACNNQQDLRVLDVGCGTGASMLWAQNSLGAKIVMGVDISWDALQFCQPLPGQTRSQASVLELPFRSGFFDLLICQDVLQHLPTDGSDIRALIEMRRVLRPGGLLLLRTNSRLGMWQAETARDSDYQRYTLPEVVARIQAAGFRVKRATYTNCLPSLYATVKRWVQLQRHRRHHPQPLYEGLNVRDTAACHPVLNRLLLGILKIEARYLSTPGRSLAFGHSTLCVGVKPPDGTAESEGGAS